MNIREFAQLCGVSVASASRALSHPPETAELSRALYDKIRAKAQEIGYWPNFYAQRMQSAHRDVIGLIVGGDPIKIICGELIEAVGSCLQYHKKTLTVFSCSNVEVDILPAFEKMIQQGVDAIIVHVNTYQREIDIERIMSMIQTRYPVMPPIVTIFGGFSNLKCFEVRLDEDAIGTSAARRQLALGCTKFGVLSPATINPRNERIIHAYEATLKSCGIPSDCIVRVDARHMAPPEELQPLAEVEGLWLGFLLTLPGLWRGLSKVCSMSKLHVDTFCSQETAAMFEWLSPCIEAEIQSRHPFQSLHVALASLQEAGTCAAQLALEVASAKELQPFRRNIGHQYVDFNDQIKTGLLFDR